MFTAASTALESRAEAINALNVFPVPDGDTGTNMLLTMQAALEEAGRAPSASADETAAALAKGSLMGARGNSGVILSQVLRGFSRSIQGKPRLGGKDISLALREGAEQAYRVMTNPVEGTILTVAREAAAAATRKCRGTDPAPAIVLASAAEAARDAVARTPFQLEILRENGVVDAGGEGLAVLLEGALRFLRGEPVEALRAAAIGMPAARADRGRAPGGKAAYGFCTEVLLERCAVGPAELRARAAAMGDSVMVAGDEALVKVHLHTKDAEGAIAYFRTVGAVVKTKVDDIDAQHEQFEARKAVRPQGEAAVVAVVSGEGLVKLYRSLGAAAIVAGGQTMNPSAQSLIEAARSVPHQTVVLLPNNGNVITTARQAQELAPDRRILVVPSADLAQGVAAIMAFNFERSAAGNRDAMEQAMGRVQTGEVTRAVKDARIEGKAVREGQFIGLARGTLASVAGELPEAVLRLLEHLGARGDAAITLYQGQDVDPSEAQRVEQAVRQRFPEADVTTYEGGQPHYHYLAAVE